MHRKWLGPRRLGLLLALTIAGLAPVAEAGAEGTYMVYTCRAQNFAVVLPAPVSDWAVTTSPKSGVNTFGASCPNGPLTLDMSGAATHPFDDYMHMKFTAPPDTQIQDYGLFRSVQLADKYNYRLWQGFSDGTSLELDTCFPSQGCKSKGSAGAPDSATNKVCGGTICPRGRSDITSLMVSITCAVSSGSCPAVAPGARFQLHRADVRLVDKQDPVLTGPPTGALVAGGGPVSGVQRLTVSAGDRGGGVYEVLAEVDGVVHRTVLDDNGGLCRRPFMAAVPCKLAAGGAIDIDTSALPDGRHSLKVWVSDVAGNVSGAWGPVEFSSANASCNPEPRVPGMTMRAGFATRAGKLRNAVTTNVGRGIQVSGRLLDAAGQPVAGAPVCFAVRDDLAGAPLRLAGATTSDADGRVTVKLPPGASRVVYLVHRVPGGAITGTARVQVRAGVRLGATRTKLRNGQTLQMRGRLRARGRAGVLVELQARRASGWQTFGTTRTGRGGTFRYGYPFTRTSGLAVYRLRARVPRQGIYPFAAGASRALTVKVRG